MPTKKQNPFQRTNLSDFNTIVLRGVRTHNLKGINVELPKSNLIAITGVSGSGKSSLAFDTLFAEGQRRYTESLSTYVRQFLDQMKKPPVEAIENIQPALALRQKNDNNNVRSTVGSVTEINEHLQLLFAKGGQSYCPNGHGIVRRDTVMSTVDDLIAIANDQRVCLVASVRALEEEHRGTVLRQLVKDGYRRLYVDNSILEIDEKDSLDRLLSLEEFPVLIDRFKINNKDKQRIGEAIETGFAVGHGKISVVLWDQPDRPIRHYNQSFTCNICGVDLVEPRPEMFNFNSSLGACPACDGRGRATGIDYKLVIPNETLSVLDGAITPFMMPSQRNWQKKLVEAMRHEGYAIDVPYRRLPQEAKNFILRGKQGSKWTGIRGFFNFHRNQSHRRFSRIIVARYRGYDDCEACNGSRLGPAAQNVLFHDKHIGDFWNLPIDDLAQWFDLLELTLREKEAIGIVVNEIRNRIKYLVEIGVGYLTLGRSSTTLSGGETQSVDLTTSLGRALTDTLYVLDEPTAGLHARDSLRLLEILNDLRDLGNTVVVVEHDPDIIKGADFIVEIGPGAGHLGGELIFQGESAPFFASDTLTAKAIREKPAVEVAKKKAFDHVIKIRGAHANNLENIDVDIPVGCLTAVTGVSGSGKSTLMFDTVYRQFLHHQGQAVEAGEVDEIVGFDAFSGVEMMDQGSIGRSSRSNAMTYTGAYDEIRKIFASTHDAKRHAISPRDFSINVTGGRCEECSGLGYQSIDMHFLADIEVECEVCHGKRFEKRILEVYYKGKNINDVFEMTISEGIDFFAESPRVIAALKPLVDVGLGYLTLGQSTATLSGGEAQRLKLATYMVERKPSSISTKPNLPILFIFDEPTVGLHIEDIKTLLIAMRRLVDKGHTVVVVEHNIEFIAECDHVIDLGPEAGIYGGTVVAQGTPSEVAEVEGSHTGRFLKLYFKV